MRLPWACRAMGLALGWSCHNCYATAMRLLPALLMVTALTPTACSTVPGGDGLGLPFFAQRPAMNLGLRIGQISLDPGAPSVRLMALGDAVAAAQNGLHLLTAYDDVDLLSRDPTLLQIGGAGVVTAVPELVKLHWAAGELLLTDDDYIPQAYVAWGNAPENFNSGLANLALDANLVRPGQYVPVPFIAPAGPLPPLVYAPDQGQVGCLGGSPNTVVSCGQNPPLQAIQMTAIAPARADPNTADPRLSFGSLVVLTNNTAATLAIYGLNLCRGSDCRMLDANGPTYTLASHGNQTFYVGNSPDPNALVKLPLPYGAVGTASTASVLTGNEELALAPPGVSPITNPNAVLWSYVRMGVNAPQALTAQAALSGLWVNDGSFAAAPTMPHQALQLAVGAYGGTANADDWTVQ